MIKNTLQISVDDKFLINENGDRVRRYDEQLEGFVLLDAPDSISNKGSGWHWECSTECIAWDEDGNCVRTYRTCDPVFDDPPASDD